MAHDVTLTIMLDPPAHDISSDPSANASRYKIGDIVLAKPSTVDATWNGSIYIMHQNKGNNRFIFLHVTGVPEQFTLDIINEKICASIDAIIPTDPPTYRSLRRRKFRVIPSSIPTLVRAAWLADKEYTITFSQFKNYVYKKTLVDNDDPSLDDESVNITETDLI